MSTKLHSALEEILEGARASRIKEASVDIGPLYTETTIGNQLRKLAGSLRVENTTPTYQELNNFIVGLK